MHPAPHRRQNDAANSSKPEFKKRCASVSCMGVSPPQTSSARDEHKRCHVRLDVCLAVGVRWYWQPLCHDVDLGAERTGCQQRLAAARSIPKQGPVAAQKLACREPGQTVQHRSIRHIGRGSPQNRPWAAAGDAADPGGAGSPNALNPHDSRPARRMAGGPNAPSHQGSDGHLQPRFPDHLPAPRLPRSHACAP